MDKNEKMVRAYDGTLYLPGIVGLNNIKANDYCNVILQVGKKIQTSVREEKPSRLGVDQCRSVTRLFSSRG